MEWGYATLEGGGEEEKDKGMWRQPRAKTHLWVKRVCCHAKGSLYRKSMFSALSMSKQKLIGRAPEEEGGPREKRWAAV